MPWIENVAYPNFTFWNLLGFPLWANAKWVLTNALLAVKDKVYFRFTEYKLDIYPLSQTRETHYSIPLHPNSSFTYLICQRLREVCWGLPLCLHSCHFLSGFLTELVSYTLQLYLAVQKAPDAYVLFVKLPLTPHSTALSVLLSASLAPEVHLVWYLYCQPCFLFVCISPTNFV